MDESPRFRLSILGIVAFSLFAALFARLYYLQVMATSQGEVEADANRVRVLTEEAPRGRILDAKGRVIVDNRTSLIVTVDPTQLKELPKDQQEQVLLRVAESLTSSGIPTKVAALERRLSDPQFNPLQPIPVAVDVPDELEVYLAERADDFPSVQVRRESVREYPQGSLAAHVLGYVGRISQKEFVAKMGTRDDPKVVAKPYEPDSNIGKTGIEETFEDDLRGVPGIRKIEVDVKGKAIRQLDYQRPVPGSDVQLTIDIDVQRTAEKSLADKLESKRGTYTQGHQIAKAQAGAAVVLDPRNGNVIAMASYPTYDPGEFVNGISTDRYLQLTGGDTSDNPLTNRAVAGQYAPGSTFKLITAMAAIEKGVKGPYQPFYDSGTFMIPGCTGNGCARHNAEQATNGVVDMPRALTVSSDVYFYQLGLDFWTQRQKVGDGIQEVAHQLGMGAPTGVQLPDELAGLIPDPAIRKQRHEQNPKAFPEGQWFPGDNVNLAIGQGEVLVTPLQLANAYATFIDHGTLHRPTLVWRVLSPWADATAPALVACASDYLTTKAGCVVRTIDQPPIAKFDIPANVFDPIRAGLAGVTTDPHGTATGAFAGFDQKAFPLLGKTGTAQEPGLKADNSLFVGIGPADDPQYVAVAVLEQAGFGAEAAAPVVRSIFEQVSGQAQPADSCAVGSPGTPSSTTTTVTAQPTACPDVSPGGATGNGTGGTTPPVTGGGLPPATTTTRTTTKNTTTTVAATTTTGAPPPTPPPTTSPTTTAPTTTTTTGAGP